MNPRRIMFLLATLSATVLAGGAFGQAQEIGATSYDEVTVQAEIQESVRIILSSNLLNLGSYTVGDPDLQGDLSFCVYSNTLGNAYSIAAESATGSAATDPFTLASLADAVTYAVAFDDSASFSAAAENLENRGAAVGPYTGGTDSTCAADNASIRVTVAATGNLEAALPGTYTDTLRLTVAPL